MDVEKTIREYLPDILHMSLATSKDNQPWVTEVHFAYDDDLNFYFRSLPSRRHSQEIVANPKVAGNIVTQHVLDQKLRGLYFEGTASLLENVQTSDAAAICIKDRLKAGDEAVEEAMRTEGHKYFKISVTKFYVFDSREHSPGQKFELEWNTHK